MLRTLGLQRPAIASGSRPAGEWGRLERAQPAGSKQAPVGAGPTLTCPCPLRALCADGKSAAATLNILKTLNERTCRKRCATGSGGKSVG